MAELEKKEVEKKPKRVKRVVKYTFLQDVGTDENGCIRYKKGESYELTKKQIINYKQNKIVCQL